MHWNSCYSSIVVFQEKRGSREFGSVWASWSYRDLLNADKLQRHCCGPVALKTEFNNFASTFHQDIESFGLCMAARETWYRCNVVTILVSLNDDGEFPFGFHGIILHLKKRAQWSVVILQPQMCNQFFAFQVPERVLQLHELDEQIVLGVEPRRGHRRLEVEAQPFLNADPA